VCDSESRAVDRIGAATLLFAVLSGLVSGQVTTRVSLGMGGTQGNGSSSNGRISADGRFVCFSSSASNLVSGDTNGKTDIFVRDRWSGTNERVSVNTNEGQFGQDSAYPSISADGRTVAFAVFVSLFPPRMAVLVRDRQTGTTEEASVSSSEVPGDLSSWWPSISADGRYVAFHSEATNLVAGDTNGVEDGFVRDLQNGTTERVSVGSGGVQGDDSSGFPWIAGDGRFVSFGSAATNLVAGDTNISSDIFVRDRQTGTTERVSVPSGGGEANGSSSYGAISADGRYVVFMSYATNLVAGDTNGIPDLFVHDRQSGTTERVNVGPGGVQADSTYLAQPLISADGRWVSFMSNATNLVPGDTNGVLDGFVRDLQSATTERMTVSSSGVEGNGSGGTPSVSADGRFAAFGSLATNLVAGDTNAVGDVFVRDRAPTSFTSLCDPGVGGVIACPCSNPPSGPGRGCDNSSVTGGAILTASGVAYLSMDSLVFSTSGEKPTALSIVAQWIGGSASGAVFGMGVRCTSGTLKRLFSKSAVAGSITAPNFGAGDPTVSAQSALKGDTIPAGQSRWYVVYYRDNTILGGCSATSNFNATQTGRVAWSP